MVYSNFLVCADCDTTTKYLHPQSHNESGRHYRDRELRLRLAALQFVTTLGITQLSVFVHNFAVRTNNSGEKRSLQKASISNNSLSSHAIAIQLVGHQSRIGHTEQGLLDGRVLTTDKQ